MVKLKKQPHLQVRLRINEHHSAIRNFQTKATPISKHWAECKHNVAQLRWQVLEEMKNNHSNVDKKMLVLEARHSVPKGPFGDRVSSFQNQQFFINI
ncbi:hypothetical protein XELAEV_18020315mg [Xenopus laevis]|uniref:Uncharacterized protein n=1 Tax=Xenopus laevis TaxID=8355 RepID=A0A974D6N6_XENLA|nr:hypothetical protein XELAEV_18020315mg [Xenopus laevis]